MSHEQSSRSQRPLRILYVATKPPYPPLDGGRLLIWNTLNELASRGHRITYVAPDLGQDTAEPMQYLETVCESATLVPARPAVMWSSAVSAFVTRRPLSVLRHTHSEVQRVIVDLLSTESFDLVHAEQIQAFSNIPRNGNGPPVILRAQNVESELWRMVAARLPRWAWIARDEARKMAMFEARAVRNAAATVVLTRTDAAIFGGGAGPKMRRITVVRPPFPAFLPSLDRSFTGDPPVVSLGGGWLPNRDSAAWFLRELWPAIRRANPGAHAHVFGSGKATPDQSISYHASPIDSAGLFRPGSVLAVPLRIGSGIRMKILEAWARGVPVVATPTAVRGLDDVGEGAYLLAAGATEFGAAVARLRTDPDLVGRLIDAGRTALESHFHPSHSLAELERVYSGAITHLS